MTEAQRHLLGAVEQADEADDVAAGAWCRIETLTRRRRRCLSAKRWADWAPSLRRMDANQPPPTAAPNGLFEPVIGRAPASWPWALPHLYAANVASEAGDAIVSASADPAGAYLEERSRRTDLGRVEIVGFWNGHLHVIDSEAFGYLDRARQAAKDAFDRLPIRFLMECGRVTQQNPAVEISGTWPEQWTFLRLQDLGVLCAFLYESAVARGAGEQANRFRALLHVATPATEQLVVYVGVLEAGRELLGPFLPKAAHTALKAGLKTARKWLR
jgi:hypothetical protein